MRLTARAANRGLFPLLDGGHCVAGKRADVLVIGGGIVGCAVARELAGRGLAVEVLEKEDDLARHASGRNSGVLHSGVFNRPGTIKAEMTRRGLPEIVAYCRERGVPHRNTGKVIAADGTGDLAPLERLKTQGEENGLDGLEVRPAERMAEAEPRALPRPHLFVPQAGVVDSVALVRALAEDARKRGAVFRLGTRVIEVERRGAAFSVATDRGEAVAPRLVNAAGLHADEVAWQLGAAGEFVIV